MVQLNAVKSKQDVNPLLKLVLEMGPLALFFGTYVFLGRGSGDAVDINRIIYSTGALMIATVISLVASRMLLKRIPVMPLVTGVFVLFFGTLTIWLQDATFIKIKPTILNLFFASALAGGLLFRKLLLKIVLGEVLQLEDEGWRILTLRWIGFFIVLAILNEIVWRGFSTDTWVSFKSFGIMPLTFLFMMSQITLIMKHQTPAVSSPESQIPSN